MMRIRSPEPQRSKPIREKKVLVKHIRKKSSKVSTPIAGLVGYPASDIQANLMKTNIIIPALHLFQILPKFRKEMQCFMTVPRKLRKKRLYLRLLIKKKTYMQR